MLRPKRIEERLHATRRWPGPILSAYVPLEPEVVGADRAHVVTRVRSTFAAAGVPDDLTRRVADEVAKAAPTGRTLVVFEGPNDSERFVLPVDVPVVERTSGHFEAAYGERAYVAPLLLALDHAEHLGVVFVDRERVRCFETYLDDIEHLFSARSEPEPDQPHVASSSKQVRPAYQAARDDAHQDRQREHRREVRTRFYDDVIVDLAAKLDAAGVERFIIVGPERAVNAFERRLPTQLAERVAARTSSLSTPDAAPSAVLDKLRPTIEQLVREREERVVDAVATNQGAVRGTAETLTALQRGRVDTVIVPWHPGAERTSFVARSGWVGATREDARAHGSGGPVDDVDLMEVLPALTERFGADLTFILGDARDRLGNGELAGILRW
ncbi:MAG: VLRF1 family aeRF1-type release factor [Deltaproteobacteria bacterium]